LFATAEGLIADIPLQQPSLAALVAAVRELAEMHVPERLIQRDPVAANAGNPPPLGLPRVEIRRRQNDLVTDPPLARVEDFDPRAAGLGGLGQLRPGVLAIAMQAQRPAGNQDPAVTHAVDVLVGDVVGQGDRRVARVGLALAADLECPAEQNPLGRELEILVIRKAEPAVDMHAIERRRTDVEDDVHACGDRDDVAFLGHRPAGPRGRIGPQPSLDRRRTLPLRAGVLVRRGRSLRLGAGAYRETGWNEQRKEERAIASSHGTRLPPGPRDFQFPYLSRKEYRDCPAAGLCDASR